MSLLTIIQNAAIEVGIIKPTTAFANTNPDIVKLMRLSNKVGLRLMKLFPWEILSAERTFTSVATEEQVAILPADFDRFVPETFWNRTDVFLLSGPVGHSEWQGKKATSFSDTENRRFRLRGGKILVIPTIAAGKDLAYEYVSKNWNETSGQVGQTAWGADADTGIIDEELMTRGVIWEYLANEGLPNSSQAYAYEEYFETLCTNDRPWGEVATSGDIFGGQAKGRHFTGAPPVAGSGGLF